jgi:UDP-sulfoquinovose synthase
MQGPVYGLSTEESDVDVRLLPNFNYDELFGTVLNRFIVQAVADYPLSIYGGGTQTRGYLNIRDTLKCVYLAASKPPGTSGLGIFNQFTETFSVNQLAEIVARVGKARDYNVVLNNIPNPRVEKEEHYYNPAHTGLKELGLESTKLDDAIVDGIFEIVEKYKSNINRAAFFRGVNWK